MIDMFMEASLRGEGFNTPEDEVAARLEMRHAFGQGIISKELPLENAHLTLKALFLYARSSGSMKWVQDRDSWGDVVDIAVLRLLDVFKDEGDANHAYEWMNMIDVDKALSMATRIFITPMFPNEDETNDDGADDDVERGGDEGGDIHSETGGDVGPSNGGGIRFGGHLGNEGELGRHRCPCRCLLRNKHARARAVNNCCKKPKSLRQHLASMCAWLETADETRYPATTVSISQKIRDEKSDKILIFFVFRQKQSTWSKKT